MASCSNESRQHGQLQFSATLLEAAFKYSMSGSEDGHHDLSSETEVSASYCTYTYSYLFRPPSRPSFSLFMFGFRVNADPTQDDEEVKLPKTSSMVIILMANLLLQV